MARAGHCSQCGSNVWLTDEGACPNGHGAECISNVYDASTPPPPTAGQIKAKKKWPWVVGAIFLLLVCGIANGGTKTGNKPPATSTTAQETPAPAAPAAAPAAKPAAPAPTQEKTEPAPEPVAETPGYEAGMYKVGSDLPAAVYVLVADGQGYFQITKDSSGQFESIIANDNFSNRSIVDVSPGQYLTVKSARIVPFDKAPKAQAVNGLLPEGMYKVGVDLPAGEYKLVSDGGSGYAEVDKNATHAFDAIVSNDNFEGEKYLTVKDGQFLKLNGASLKLK